MSAEYYPPKPEQGVLIGLKGEPWKCQGPCGQLMYNTEYNHVDDELPKIYPREGVPIPKHVPEVGNCCSMCFEMDDAVRQSAYLSQAQQDWKDSRKDMERRINKLKSDGNYLG